MTRRTRICGAWIDNARDCGEPGRLYPCGPRCDTHAPWAVAGLPDPRTQVDPALTIDGLRRAAGLPIAVVPTRSAGWAAVDARAIASGKRRSNPEDVRAACTELEQQKTRRRTS